MTLHTVHLTKDGDKVKFDQDPVIVQHNDQIVWFSKDGAHEGEFDNEKPTDDKKWKGDRNQPAEPVLTVVFNLTPPEKFHPFPYKARVDGAIGRSEVVVVPSR